MNVLLLGAGASKGYNGSVTKTKMPVAKDFFNTFNRLNISENPWVLIGDILNYLQRFHNIPWTGFINYNEDIEVLHTEIEDKLIKILNNGENIFSSYDNLLIYKAYTQLLFVFSSVINEIQNGTVSKVHTSLANKLNADDRIITFNWDILMDRALNESTTWTTDTGYLITPSSIYRDKWIPPAIVTNVNHPLILKLHGSTNWLTSCFRPDKGKLIPLQETPIEDFYVYESTVHPYATYKGRYMGGYSNFSYGYYPPNLPLRGEQIPDGYLLINATMSPQSMPTGVSDDTGLVSMPLIIPPVKVKDYNYYGNIFKTLWTAAEESLALADRIVIIGYSFPITDTQTDVLFKTAFSKRTNMPVIVVVDPNPEKILDRFIYTYGITPDKIIVHKSYFDESFNVNLLFS